MKTIRRFIASSDLFLGFEVYLDLNVHDSIDNIINQFQEDLIYILKRYKFEILVEKVKQCNFHIHDLTFEDIINKNTENDAIYICDNC